MLQPLVCGVCGVALWKFVSFMSIESLTYSVLFQLVHVFCIYTDVVPGAEY